MYCSPVQAVRIHMYCSPVQAVQVPHGLVGLGREDLAILEVEVEHVGKLVAVIDLRCENHISVG